VATVHQGITTAISHAVVDMLRFRRLVLTRVLCTVGNIGVTARTLHSPFALCFAIAWGGGADVPHLACMAVMYPFQTVHRYEQVYGWSSREAWLHLSQRPSALYAGLPLALMKVVSQEIESPPPRSSVKPLFFPLFFRFRTWCWRCWPAQRSSPGIWASSDSTLGRARQVIISPYC
jgi:hypothetical protein